MIQEDEEATRLLWFDHIILFLVLVVADGQGGSWFECLCETGGKIIIVISSYHDMTFTLTLSNFVCPAIHRGIYSKDDSQ